MVRSVKIENSVEVEATFKQGNFYSHEDGEVFLCVRPGREEKLLLISLKDGNRWDEADCSNTHVRGTEFTQILPGTSLKITV